MRGVACAAALAGCARMGPPPGGPPDFRAPMLVATDPESLAVRPDFSGWASFTFDEVISEGGTPNFGTGRGALEQLAIVSPDTGVPHVRWRRNRLEVQPRMGWRPNTVYRIEFAPGLTDLSRNARDEPTTLTFTTGAPQPTRYLTGRAVNWLERRFVRNALIIATYPADSTVYRTVTDSVGRFRFGPLPNGEVLVSASIESGQPDRRLSPTREAWDTVRVGAMGESVGEIWAFARDTLPPRLAQGGATRVDSFTIAIALNQPLDPTLRLDSTNVTLRRLPDSTQVAVISALPQAIHDSIYQPIDSARRAQAAQRAQSQRTDSLKKVRADSMGISIPQLDSLLADSLAKNPAPAAAVRREQAPAARTVTDSTPKDEPLEKRAPISARLYLRVNGIIGLGERYLIEIRGVRALGGAIADTIRAQLVTPEPPKPAATAGTADSASRVTRSDTAQGDSTSTRSGPVADAAQLPPPRNRHLPFTLVADILPSRRP